MAFGKWIKLATFASFAALIAAAPATQPALEDFVATGQVLDDAGKPMSGVYIAARCGANELPTVAHTTTDRTGHYKLVFQTSTTYERGLGHPIIGEQVALIGAYKSKYFDKNLLRSGYLLMTDDRNVPESKASEFAGVIYPGKPYTLNFTLAKGATIEGRLVDLSEQPVKQKTIWITGDDVPPNATTLSAVKTDSEGYFKFTNVPTGYIWSFMFRDNLVDQDMLSEGFKLSSSDPIEVTIVYNSDKHTITAAESQPTQNEK